MFLHLLRETSDLVDEAQSETLLDHAGLGMSSH